MHVLCKLNPSNLVFSIHEVVIGAQITQLLVVIGAQITQP